MSFFIQFASQQFADTTGCISFDSRFVSTYDMAICHFIGLFLESHFLF